MWLVGRILYRLGVWIVGFVIGFVFATAVGMLLLTAWDAVK